MNQFKNSFLISFLTISMVMSILYTQGQKSIQTKSPIDVAQTTFSAGADASICHDGEFVTQGVCKSQVMTMWQSSGDGIFENSNDLVTRYIPGTQDIAFGSVTLTLVLLPMGGNGSEAIFDEMILSFGVCEAPLQFD